MDYSFDNYYNKHNFTHMKQQKPKFYAFYKDFNNGTLKTVDVLSGFFSENLTEKGVLSKKKFTVFDKKISKYVPITSKEQLEEHMRGYFIYHYWSRCEWEYIIVDWPYKDRVDDARPHKIDVYEQISPNMELIVDLVWNYVEPKIKK